MTIFKTPSSKENGMQIMLFTSPAENGKRYAHTVVVADDVPVGKVRRYLQDKEGYPDVNYKFTSQWPGTPLNPRISVTTVTLEQ